MLIAPHAHAAETKTVESFISHETRLMVFSPHPDDETIGAGGLIQRVLGAGGKVRIVFMTSGDGYLEGVERENHVTHPTAKDFRSYGREREEEARKALAILGVKKEDLSFLGFPDGGLCQLLLAFRSDPTVYTSPFTKENRPPSSEIIVSHTDYDGEDLKKEIKRLLIEFRPTLVALTPPEDMHPDHCSTYHFFFDSLKELQKKTPSIKPEVLAFLIHFGSWPSGKETGDGSFPPPPKDFPDKQANWVSFSLLPREVEAKREAILQYHTQEVVLGKFLLEFAKTNELFILEETTSSQRSRLLPDCAK
jgi:LmbE family N-acetylglucosaminyl deacetylase